MYPALAVVEWLTTEKSWTTAADDNQRRLSVLWVGQDDGMEADLVKSASLQFSGISAAAVRGKSPLALMKSLAALVRGWRQARRLVAEFRPDVLFVTGGYVCWPVTLAAKRAGVPVLIYLPDVVPGLAIKSLARFANQVAVTTAASIHYFRAGKTVVTGYPVRRRLFSGDVKGARRRLKLETRTESGERLPVLLVFGGSQGARSINQAVVAGLPDLLQESVLIHVTGRLDYEQVMDNQAQLPEELRSRYRVFAYLDKEMVDAMLAADLVVARAGASTMGELPAAGLPAVLVPYPYAGAHQWHNAQYLAEAGMAVTVADERLAEDLVSTVVALLKAPERRLQMARSARALARPEAAAHIATQLEALAQ